MAGDPEIDASAPWPHQISPKNYPYSPSTASTASSSSSSVFSIDAPSSQSSVASSSGGWSSSAWINENEDQHISRPSSLQGSATSSNEEVVITTYNPCQRSRVHPPADAVAPESRQHPRRTQRLNSYESQDGKATTACPRPPPSLVRQSERKDNFVDSLVDTTTQMIETIWPLSVLSCGRDTILGGKQQNLIGLRTFVQEVLRRSKTSYSTLQVALYYLILIQSCVPKHDFTMEQSEDSPTCRAMQCGRRMFLAALILASKYLQDRNFSARAWSKISGLRTCEINQNELAFLSAVNWKLHIPEPVFHLWTDIVLKYSPSAQVNGLPRSCPMSSHSWKSIIPLLTPELDAFDFGSAEVSDDSGYNSPSSDMSPPPIPYHKELSPCSTSNEPTPTNPYTIPRILEPSPRDTKADEQIMPLLPRMGPLPTPQLTPQTSAFCTPARPVVVDDDMSWEAFTASPETYQSQPKPFDLRCNSTTPTNHSASTREAAAALRDLALNRQHPPPQEQPNPRPQKCRKRSRPDSVDLSVQSCVRDLIAPRFLGEITNMQQKNEEDGTVLPDDKLADSFVVLKCDKTKPPLNTVGVNFMNGKPKSALSRDGLPRKRTCAGSDRGGKEEARMMMRLIKERELDGSARPGMWEGII
ncbi:hypothetical protein OEA41_005444 [Lepraria neglecta]|uniref:Uncharacterized protein n=1 Tax=Lepraria neglecta TaxID=209136 RepID=A0AAD9Z128_9LECA|nr:hypothetical protein OEA41_005444 [Lepraria neglecta]